MRVKSCADSLIKGLGDTASEAFPIGFVNGFFVDIVCSHASWNTVGIELSRSEGIAYFDNSEIDEDDVGRAY
jgi:hypothetical protein